MARGYHHGDLPTALVDAALELIAEQGFGAFSVAAIARRAGVSLAAPYRHFSDRSALVAAVAWQVADQLLARIRAAAVGDDPVERLAAAAGAYTRFVIERRAGLHVIYADEVRGARHAALHAHTRLLTDELLALTFAVAPDAAVGLELMEQILAQAHGYGTLFLDGVLGQGGYDVEQVVAKSAAAARTVIRGRAEQ